MKDFTEWMDDGFEGDSNERHGMQMSKQLELNDGTKLSIQASWGHYSQPRANHGGYGYDFYESFEIGYPTSVIDEILEFAEDKESPTNTVYGYVPKQVIREFIEKRGGVKGLV